MREATERFTVGDLTIDPVPCIPAPATLGDVALVLATTRAGTVIVTAHPPVVVTECDVVRAVAEGVTPGTGVDELATEPPPVAHESTPVSAVLRAMLEFNARSLIVLDEEDHPLGVVTLAAVLETVLGGPSWVAALRLALQIEQHAL